jgi:hypothetical protein
MRRRSNVLTSVTSLFAMAAVIFAGTLPAFAADSVSGGNGLRISPVSSNLTISPGGSKTLDVYITNITSQKATFQAVVNDFTASSDESGTPALILNDGQSAPTHSLRKFVPTLSNVTLNPGEQKDVKVPITVPSGTPAGGYFGAVRFSAVNNASGSQNVALSASVASLVLLKVPGDYKEVMSIQSLDVRRHDRVHTIFTNGKNLDTTIRFKNSGDIQEAPFGKITVTKSGGKVVYTTEVNSGEAPGNVLPGSVRKFTVPLKGIGSFGKYTVTGDFGYGQGQTLTAKTTFYVLPIPVIIFLIVLIGLIIFLIVELPRLIKRYNKRILRRAGRN